MTLGKQVLSGLKVGAALRAGAQLFTWVNTLILIRLLTPDDYGLMSMTMLFVAMFTLVGDFGIGKALVQTQTLSELQWRQAFTVNALANLGFFTLFVTAAPLIADFFNEPELTLLVRVVAFQHLCMMFQTLPQGLAGRQMLFKQREQVQFAAILLTSVLTITLAALGFGVWSLIVGHLFMRAALAIGFTLIAPCWVKPTVDFSGFSHIAGFSGIATVNEIGRSIINLFSSISMGRILTKADLGVFSVSQNLANLPNDKIGELLNHVGLASLSSVQNEPHRAGEYLLNSVQLAASVLFPLYFGMCAVAPEVIDLILSDTWSAAIIPFQVLCLTSAFRLLSELLGTAATAIGSPKRHSHALLMTAITLPLFLLSLQKGVVGASVAWTLISLFSFMAHLGFIWPLFQRSTWRFWSAISPGFLSAGLMLAALLWMRAQWAESLPPWLLLGVLMVAGILLYVGVYFICFRQRFLTTLAFLRR